MANSIISLWRFYSATLGNCRGRRKCKGSRRWFQVHKACTSITILACLKYYEETLVFLPLVLSEQLRQWVPRITCREKEQARTQGQTRRRTNFLERDLQLSYRFSGEAEAQKEEITWPALPSYRHFLTLFKTKAHRILRMILVGELTDLSCSSQCTTTSKISRFSKGAILCCSVGMQKRSQGNIREKWSSGAKAKKKKKSLLSFLFCLSLLIVCWGLVRCYIL